MGYDAKVLADSLSPEGVRLTTFQVRYPHAIHKDVMTHRMLSRNFQSFRAFPPEKVIEEIIVDPFVPEVFDTRVKGMGQGEAHPDQDRAREIWNQHIDHSITMAKWMIETGLAKAQVNFVLQDLTWITGIISATDWDNFWALRLDTDEDGKPMARPEVFKIVSMIREAYDAGEPRQLDVGQWHMPLVDNYESQWCWEDDDPLEWNFYKKVSVGRCARVSYLTHDGKRENHKDIELHNRLLKSGHMSPFEHVATPLTYWTEQKNPGINPATTYSGNFRGWHQYRKDIPYESNFGEMKKRLSNV